MNFNASMQRLLRLRRSLERQEEMKLALASAHLHTAEAGLEASRAEGRARHDARLASPELISGAELQAADLQRAAAQERELRLEGDLEGLRAAHHDQRTTLLDRTRERKTLDTLQQHQIEALRREQLRREQASLDEGFLLSRPKR